MDQGGGAVAHMGWPHHPNPKGGALGGKFPPLAADPRWGEAGPLPHAYIRRRRGLGRSTPYPSRHPSPSSLPLSCAWLGEALSAENLHHIHHHTVVLLESRQPLLPRLRDQGEEVYTKMNVWISRRCCSCGASSDWIIHLLATR